MRVNVSKAFFSKTFMYGLKVLLNRKLIESNNKKAGKFNLTLNNKNIKQTLIIATVTQLLLVAVTILVELAILATLLLTALLALLHEYTRINIFISFNVFDRLTFLMNDLRLRTFYCKSTNCSKFIKSSKTTANRKTFGATLVSISTINLSTLTSRTAVLSSSSSSSAPATAAVFATPAILCKQTSGNNNNRHRTYKNNSKSNKIFLYYTPHDPRLRIFLKTKHFFKISPRQQQYKLHNFVNTCCCLADSNKNLYKILSDLCNYGELIGGSYKCGEHNCAIKQTFNKQFNCTNLKSIKIICDNLRILSDNDIVATAAGAAIETISVRIYIDITVVALIIAYIKELRKSIGISLLSLYCKQQQLKDAAVGRQIHHWLV